MLTRLHPAVVPCGGSALLAIVLVGLLAWEVRPRGEVVVFAAASLRPPLELAADDYYRRTGIRVELRFGGSEEILTQAKLTAMSHPADIFFPADESYIATAAADGLTAETQSIATMRGVVLTAPGNPRRIATWADLTADGVRIGLAEPEVAAIGLLTKRHLRSTGKWDALDRRVVVRTATVTQSANAAKLATVDAAIVWDAVAFHYPGQATIRLPELDGIIAKVTVAVLKQTREPDKAREFMRYLSSDGLAHFRTSGFRVDGP